MASEICQSPIALISLVMKTSVVQIEGGLEASETDRDISFCAHTILDSKPLVGRCAVPRKFATTRSGRTLHPALRRVLKTDINHRIGTLCVIDRILNHSPIRNTVMKAWRTRPPPC